jgi:methylenetetrahydrofolate--tRNA-(uracil-5-)-methyltransferase
MAGIALAARISVEEYAPPPRTTALGSLVHYITHADPRNYQPANMAFDLLPPMQDLPRAMAHDRQTRRRLQCERALTDSASWVATVGLRESTSRFAATSGDRPRTTDALHG